MSLKTSDSAHLEPSMESSWSACRSLSADSEGAGSCSGFRRRKKRKQPTRLMTVRVMKTVWRSWSGDKQQWSAGRRHSNWQSGNANAPYLWCGRVLARRSRCRGCRRRGCGRDKRSSNCGTLNAQRESNNLLELQQRPEDAAVSSDGAVRGVDGEHVTLRRPQDCHANSQCKDSTSNTVRHFLFKVGGVHYSENQSRSIAVN